MKMSAKEKRTWRN